MRINGYTTFKGTIVIIILTLSFNTLYVSCSREQEVNIKSDTGSLGDQSGDVEQMMNGNGILLVKSQGDSTAELVLKDIIMKMKMKIECVYDE